MAVSTALPTVLGRYRVLARVGAGSFGRVLQVQDLQAHASRALKLAPSGEAMLLAEFEQLARLRHPALPEVFEVGRTSEPIDDVPAGAAFFVAAWIAGARADEHTWTDPARLWAVLADVAGALAVIHGAGLVHGDVAPGNVLVQADGGAVLVDLGLAAADGARGTPAYMAPEAFAGVVEPRSDLYGLGAVAIRLVTGRPPFDGATLGELIQRIATAAPPALPDLPRPLADLVGRLVARDPDARPASALAVLDELDQLAPAIAPGLARRARPAVGAPPAPASWPGARAVIDALARGLAAGGDVHVVVGGAGAGARELVDGALRRWQLAEVSRGRPAAPVIAGTLDEVAAALDVAAGSVPRALADRGAPVVLELGDDPRAGQVLAQLAAAAPAHPVVATVEAATAARAGLVVHAAPLLDEAGVCALATAMIGRAPPAAWVAGLHAAARGLPATTVDLVRSLAGEPDPFAIDWAARTTAGLAALRDAQLGALPPAARALACAIAAWGGRARVDRALATARTADETVGLADVALLERVGLARRTRAGEPGADELALDRASCDALDAAAGDELAALAGAAFDLADDAPLEALAALLSRAPLGIPRALAPTAADAPDSAAPHPRPVPRGTTAADAPDSAAPRARPVPRGTTAADAPDSAAPHPRPVPRGTTAADAPDSAAAHARPVPRGTTAADAPDSTAPHARPVPRGTTAADAPDSTAPHARPAPRGTTAADAPGSAAAHARPVPRGTTAADAPDSAAARAARACDVAEQLLARGRADRAGALARRVLDVLPARAGLIAARAASASGAYREVEALAEAARAGGADPVEAQLVVARAAQRAGELDAAEAALAALHTAHPAHPEVAGTYARLLVTRSRFAEAQRVAAAPGAPLAGLRAEAAGLAAFYLGELDEADRAFARLELDASAAGDAAAIGRALSLRGMVAQQRGQLGLASDRYREAARRLGEVGEIHAAAVAELNLGTALAERGRASEALPRLAAASRVFAELGATTEQVAADLNRGNALLAVGQAGDARDAAEAALAQGDGAPHLRAFALLVLGDARRRLGEDATAEAAYREALAIARERGDAHAQVSAYIALAEAGRAPDAPDAAIEELCASADDRDRWTIARGRLALRDLAPALELAARARACAEAAARADDADRLERALRGHAVAAQLADRAGDAALARREAERARAAHAAMLAAAAPAFRAALEADPDAARVRAPAAPAPARERGDTPHLRRLLALSRRLNTEASVERILDEVIDTAIELTAAERGFLLLRGDGGELAPVVARNFAMRDLEGRAASAAPVGSVSRSIAERAAQTGEPVMTVDAGVDERFAIAASVAALRLRSVLAVPLRQRGAVTGCIYVDHRLRGGAFDDAAASVLAELADIAAIAIENARLATDLRSSHDAIAELNGRLSAELADRDAELVRARASLPDRDRLRHPYEGIVGRSPAIVRMLGLVDRASATSLPVVLVGESGTGKELVARALHDHGPRRDGPFVAVNCSAVPEPLLESELFGHVRGAFTGADRDRRGLFEVADGGTLLLDEIADTSLAMQAKLLRVLQDGSLRRVGDTRTRAVDVRIVAASQRPLAELAAEGRFREDLRFRLEVIAIPVPPLRERDGDIALLVEHVLARLSAGRTPPRLTRTALRALAQHRWPGNVRELENALARGAALGGDVIDVGDLPDAVVAAAARPEPARPTVAEDLRLKPALAATEQAYIAAAMSRAKGNQTVAARLLGLSRFGLQKKLRRQAGDDAGDDE